MSSPPDRSARAPGARPAAAVTLAALVLVLTVLLGWLARRGIDHSDEGYYLSAAAHPLADSADLLQFGTVYHWLLLGVGTDIVRFRVVGVLLTVALGTTLCWLAFGTPALRAGKPAPPRLLRVVLSVAVGFTGVFVVVQLPLTPSYNTLALQALMVAGCGMLLAVRGGSSGRVGWTLVGLGGWLALLGKPTSAAFVAGLAVLVLVVVPGRERRHVPWAAVGVALGALATLLPLGESPAAFVDGLRTGFEASQALAEHADLVRWDRVPRSLMVWGPVLGIAAGAPVLTWVASRVTAWLAAPLLLVLTAGAVTATGRWWADDVAARTAREVLAATALLTVVALGAMLLVRLVLLLWRRRAGLVRPDLAQVRTRVGLIVFLVALPAASAFGTNQNLWTTGCRAAVFWLVVLVVYLASIRPSVGAAPVLAALVVLTAVLSLNVKAPYRYQPLRGATEPAVVGPMGGTLLLTPGDARRAAEANALSRRLGIGPDTGILDLTGDSPGWVFRLGGQPVGQAWVIGGYPGSRASASVLLRADHCALEDALLLVDPTAPRAIDPDVLHDVGLDLARDYHLGGTFHRDRIRWHRTPAEPNAPVDVYVPDERLAVPGCPAAAE